MLAGVLGVLKVIGIVFLVILAVLLVLILLVLFVPVRYRASIYIPETEYDKGSDVNKIVFSAGFSWLLHILSGGIDFPEDKQFYIKLFGIKVFPKKEKPEKKKKDKDKNDKEKTDKEKTDKNNKDNKDNKDENGVIEQSDMKEFEDNTGSQKTSADSEATAETAAEDTSSETENAKPEVEEEEDKALIEIIQDIFDKIESILKTPQNVLKKMQYTISRVCGKIKMIKTTLESDIFKRAFELVKGKLIKVLKMILPDKYKAEILLGLGDPATTAELMGAYGVLYTVTLDRVILQPDFERQVVMVKADVKGHITVFTLLYCVLVCYFNKDVKKVIRRIKKILEA